MYCVVVAEHLFIMDELVLARAPLSCLFTHANSHAKHLHCLFCSTLQRGRQEANVFSVDKERRRQERKKRHKQERLEAQQQQPKQEPQKKEKRRDKKQEGRADSVNPAKRDRRERASVVSVCLRMSVNAFLRHADVFVCKYEWLWVKQVCKCLPSRSKHLATQTPAQHCTHPQIRGARPAAPQPTTAWQPELAEDALRVYGGLQAKQKKNRVVPEMQEEDSDEFDSWGSPKRFNQQRPPPFRQQKQTQLQPFKGEWCW